MPPRTTQTPEEVAALKRAVLLGQPEQEADYPRPEDLSFTDLVGLAFTKATAYLEQSEHPSAKREYALAKTAIEDAVMRFNRARTLDLGIFAVTDTEDPEFLQMIQGVLAQDTPEGGEPA